MVDGRGPWARVTAIFTLAAAAAGYSDHSRAMAPATNGAATLVPPVVSGPPAAARPVIFVPGALRPRLPIALPRFEPPAGRPWRSQATTGMTQGCRVIAEPPMTPWFPAAATMSTPRAM